MFSCVDHLLVLTHFIMSVKKHKLYYRAVKYTFMID